MAQDKKIDWYEVSRKIHLDYKGKIEVVPKVPIKRLRDFAIYYTPGVAGPSKDVAGDRDKSFDYTLRWNYAAVISDGTRVLGLGNIGPEAGLPVMEGKALLFKYLGGVDAIPLVINARDPEKFIEVVKAVEPSFGAINLEDIESPKCFYILERLSEELNIPVWHDDQQGTALVVLAGLLNALKIVGKKLSDVRIAFIGAGAANLNNFKYIVKAGGDPSKMILVDINGILHMNREDIGVIKEKNPWLYEAVKITNPEGRTGGIPEAMRDADVVIAASAPGPGIIKKEWIKTMRDDPIVFALANPVPEIWPGEAKEAGARIVATGRSDFPNQINNSLGFPAVFRGILSVRGRKLTDEIFIAAAKAIAGYAEKEGLGEEHIVPTMEETEMYVEEALAVAMKAIEIGVARRKPSRSELEEEIRTLIYRPKKYMAIALGYNYIPVKQSYPT